MNILAHTSFIGTTGYANHARSFFTGLNKYHRIKVRNFTVGKSWNGNNDKPHDGEDYLTNEMKDMLHLQTLWNNDGTRTDFPIYNYDKNFKPDVNIVLLETNHHYFYDDYVGYKIAYNVWESTRYPDEFFKRLLDFDEVWVPSQWQFDCLVEQGYPSHRISIVPEGVDVDIFKPLKTPTKRDKIRFLLFGRWDYRKATTEIIRTFGETFKGRDDVELLCSVENPYPADGLKNTKERIKHHKLHYDNIKYLDFPSREDYIKYIQEGDVFLSCARSEGFNLPLIEAMACGTPSIYSDWGAQLQFAEGKGIPVKISHMRKAFITNENTPGEYCEPDFNDLGIQMINVVEEYKINKLIAMDESVEIRDKFIWDKIAIGASNILIEKKKYRDDNPTKIITDININFIDGAFIEIKENGNRLFNVKFIDSKNNEIKYEVNMKSNHWAKCSIKYYVDWIIEVEGIDNDLKYYYKFNPTGQRILIGFESKSLGDNLAWIPYVEKFRTEHNCNIICSSFFNYLFKDQYPEIEFIEPGKTVENIHGVYRLGMFYNDKREFENTSHISDPKKEPLLKVASDILGLNYVELKPKLPKLGKIKHKRVCIGIHSTAQCKYWNNPTGWQDVVNFLNNNGYEVRLLSKEEDGYMGNKNPDGVVQQQPSDISEILKTIQESELFIGISSGLSWLSWGAEIPTILISGFTDEILEPSNGISRIINKDVCNGCWSKFEFNPGDWNWCPQHKGTNRQFECSKNITSGDVIKEIISHLL